MPKPNIESPKNILFGENARSRLLEGLKFGHDLIFQMTTNEQDLPQNLESKDPFLDSGLSFMRDCAKKMIQECGDGAIFVALLLYKMAEESLKYGSDTLKEPLEKASSLILNSLETPNAEIVLDTTDGLHIDSDSFEEELLDAKILIIDRSITSPHDLLPLLHKIHTPNQPLVIIAHDFDGDTLSTLTINKLQGRINAYPINSKGTGQARKKFLQDIATATNATIISKEAKIGDLGRAEKIFLEKKAKNRNISFEIPLNDSNDPALKIITIAYNWAVQFSPPITSFKVISRALKYALSATLSILLSEALIVESHP